MLPLRIAARFLRTSPGQSLLIIAGIGVGIAVQIFVGSLITSLQASLVDQTIGSSPHITLTAPDEGDPVIYSERTRQLLTGDPRVEPGAVAAVRTVNGLYTDGDNSAPLTLRGGELPGIDAIYNLSERTVNGRASLGTGEIMVGTDFAAKYGVTPGDTLGLTFAGNRRATLTVVGIFDLGSAAANERSAFVGPELPRSLLGHTAEEYSAIEVQLIEPFDSAAAAAAWRPQLSGIKVAEWQTANADLLTALESQSSSSYLIQVFVLVAVALGIASTLAISAVQKTRQIGILKAMGMGDRAAGLIFLWQAALLGVMGTGTGIGMGYLLLWGFSFAPVEFTISPEPTFIAISAGVGVTVALLSSIIPTRKTSRLDPIEVIQSG
jgi:lipoprotein-releasing system permease protein